MNLFLLPLGLPDLLSFSPNFSFFREVLALLGLRGMGMDGLQTGKKLVRRHRDLNPGSPACESGVVNIMLRRPLPNHESYLSLRITNSLFNVFLG